MNVPHPANRTRPIAVIVACVLPALYAGSYFAVLSLPSSMHLPIFLSMAEPEIRLYWVALNGTWTRFPDYHGLPEWLFKPVHRCDRVYLRPGYWSGTYPRN